MGHAARANRRSVLDAVNEVIAATNEHDQAIQAIRRELGTTNVATGALRTDILNHQARFQAQGAMIAALEQRVAEVERRAAANAERLDGARAVFNAILDLDHEGRKGGTVPQKARSAYERWKALEAAGFLRRLYWLVTGRLWEA